MGISRRSFRGWLEEVRRRFLANLLAKVIDNHVIPTVLPSRGIHRILVVRPNHRLGNTLLLTPLLSDLERLFPGAEIEVISAGEVAEEVFEQFPTVRHVWALPRRIVRHLPRLFRLWRYLKRTPFDLIIDPCIGSTSGRILTLAARAPHKLGFSRRGGGQTLSCMIEVPKSPTHIAQLPVYLLRQGIGENFDALPCPNLEIRLTSRELLLGSRRLYQLLQSRVTNTILIGIFASAAGNKALRADWWLSLTDRLAGIDPRVRFIEIVPAEGQSLLNDIFPTFFSTSVRGIAAVMAAMDAVISADCGVMHLAAASGVATVGLFKTTDVDRYRPYGERNVAILARDASPSEVAEYIVSKIGLNRPVRRFRPRLVDAHPVV